MNQLKATVGPSPEDTAGYAEISAGTRIIDNKSIGQDTVEGGRATLKRNVLEVTGLEPNDKGVIVIATNSAGQEVRLQTDVTGRLRDYTRILLDKAA